jgi:ribose 5-phosphate isomerase B
MNIGIASDHKGYKKKEKLLKYLLKKYKNVIDYGTNSLDSVDYTDYANKLCDDISSGKIDYGILICYTGIGMSIAANKHKNIRCAKVDTNEEAKLSRLHNNANVIAISMKKYTFEMKDFIDIFLNTEFSNEERHIRRINKML